MAHFEIAAGEVSTAVVHMSVEEIWYILSGHGSMWRKHDASEDIVELRPGLSLTIPCGTHFQFRAEGAEPLQILAITMPPWPLDREEAIAVAGKWPATLPR
jgi:mannose-6-phosphate isomerase-like protein (cupin superfamily)